MGLLDWSGFVLTAELGAAEGFINTSFYRHLAAHERHRQDAIFIWGYFASRRDYYCVLGSK